MIFFVLLYNFFNYAINIFSQNVVYNYMNMRPGSTNPSIEISGTAISSSDDLLPSDLGQSFSVSIHFKRQSANG